MPRFQLPEGLTGLAQLGAYRPDIVATIGPLAGLIFQPTDTFPFGERELVATFVSYLNSCKFCHLTHGQLAAKEFGDDKQLVEDIKCDYRKSRASPKLKALLAIAEEVQRGGSHVTSDGIQHAYAIGATERDVHDTILIASTFCMFSRYLDAIELSLPEELLAELQAPSKAESAEPSTVDSVVNPTTEASNTTESSQKEEPNRLVSSELQPSDPNSESTARDVVEPQSLTIPGQEFIADTHTTSDIPTSDGSSSNITSTDKTSSDLPLSSPNSISDSPANSTSTIPPPIETPSNPTSHTNAFTPAQRQEMINIIQQVVAAAIQAQPSNTSPTSPEVPNVEPKFGQEERSVEMAT